jgi:hypothetical protein
MGSAFGGHQPGNFAGKGSQNNSVNMSQGSLQMSDKGGGIDSSRSGAGPRTGHDF